MKKVYLVTRNINKYEEAKAILKNYDIELDLIDSNKFEIQAKDVKEIALHAAEVAYRKYKKPVLVDDTGLFIRALKGFPGPYAEYVQNTIGNRGILCLMKNKNIRDAYFQTALAFRSFGIRKVFIGILRGKIATNERGKHGFGYDPIFIPEGKQTTLAELPLEEKNEISHRAIAFKMFAEWFKKYTTALS